MSPTARIVMGTALVLVCGWQASGAPGDDSARVDLLPALARSDVCPGAGEHCWPAAVSMRLHRAPATPELVVLPPRARCFRR